MNVLERTLLFIKTHHITQPFFFARNHNNWLREQVKQEIKSNYADTFFVPLKKKQEYFLDRVCGRGYYWVWTLFVPAILFVVGVYLPIDRIPMLCIEKGTLPTLIDQRTANVAAIISMTLAVVGFLLSNMVVKDSYAYSILFHKSRLYGVIYFILVTVGCLIIISTIRDSIPYLIQIRLIVIGTILVLTVLVLIAHLFRTIIHFTNTRSIDTLFRDELIREAKISLEYQLRVNHSREIFIRMATGMGAVEYNIFEAFANDTFNQEHKLINEEEVFKKNEALPLLNDINLVDVLNFIQERIKEGKVYYDELALEESIESPDNFIWGNTRENTVKEKMFLRESVVLRRKESLQENILNARKFFEEKLGERTGKDKNKGLDDILDGYFELYKLEIKITKNDK